MWAQHLLPSPTHCFHGGLHSAGPSTQIQVNARILSAHFCLDYVSHCKVAGQKLQTSRRNMFLDIPWALSSAPSCWLPAHLAPLSRGHWHGPFPECPKGRCHPPPPSQDSDEGSRAPSSSQGLLECSEFQPHVLCSLYTCRTCPWCIFSVRFTRKISSHHKMLGSVLVCSISLPCWTDTKGQRTHPLLEYCLTLIPHEMDELENYDLWTHGLQKSMGKW